MTAKCCAKQNITTYADGTGVCQSCRTTFEAGEITSRADPDEVNALDRRVEELEGVASDLRRQLEELYGISRSLDDRVLALEGRVVNPS